MPYNYSTEEEFFEERKKKILKIGLVLVFSFLLIFVLIKIFTLNPKRSTEIVPSVPKTTPLEEVEINWPEKESVEIKESVFLSLIKIENYNLEGLTLPEGFKFLSLEVELENKSTESVNFQSFVGFSEWIIISHDGRSYYSIYPWTYTPPAPFDPSLRQPALLLNKEFQPGTLEKGYISFRVPEDISIKEIIFYVGSKKIIYQISPP